MNRKLLSTLLVVTIISISLPAAFADTISTTDDTRCVERDDCDETGPPPFPFPGPSLEALLDFFAVTTHPTDDIIDEEEVIPILSVPALPITVPPTVEIIITFGAVVDTGAFSYEFGACTLASVLGINPVTDKQAYAVACLSHPDTVTIFVDGATTEGFPPAGDTVELTSCPVGCDFVPGTPLVFWLIPNNDRASFLADPDSFYNDDGSPVLFNPFRAPLFANDLANPGEFDQLLNFIDTSPPDIVTLFTWEDLTRAHPCTSFSPPSPLGCSDQDFTDLAFTADVAFVNDCQKAGIPVPSCECDVFLGIADGCPAGEYMPIDTPALLVAGLQTSAVWLIPIVVAGATAGIAAFQFRRK